ncbi:MAG TPA: hypothetical protein VFN09_10255 [Rhodanobacteraceae bacterium]|nr:hypothetical protein [Rhodanobacteraceae bacterium]
MMPGHRAGLATLECGGASGPVVIVLHGRGMQAADLAPFGESLGLDARFVFPDAPLALAAGGRSWWPVDAELRAQADAGRPSDLYRFDPPGRAAARAALGALCDALAPDRQRVLVGFSQGGMLAMDYVLHGGRVDALALLSSSSIALADWRPRLDALRALPLLIAHGRADDELSFAAGERLRELAVAGGAAVDWRAFDGGHGIPLPVWRALRQFLRRLPERRAAQDGQAPI